MPPKDASNNNQRQTSTTQVQLPDWLNNASQNIVGAAHYYASTLPQYTVAPITQPGQQDIQSLQNAVGGTNPAYASAQAGTQALAGYQPQQVTPGWLSGTDLSPYMNPYTQQVIDKTMPLIDQQRQMANNQSADLAAKTGAFGGSRQGVAEGVNNAQSGLYAGQLGAQLNQANFSQAQTAAQADLARSLQGQALNQQAGLAGAGLQLGANQQLGNLAGQGQTANLQGLMAALGGQTQLQQQAQAVSNAPWQDALQRLQMQEQAVGSVPYGQTQTTTGTGQGPTSNPWLTGLGGLSSLASIAGSIAPLLSDRTMKTDIEKIGKDEETDLPLYAYRYKGDSKSYPKVVGIMAQDARKKYPEQVVEIGGKLAVKSNFLSGIMERANGNS
jgi:hypothetical protein